VRPAAPRSPPRPEASRGKRFDYAAGFVGAKSGQTSRAGRGGKPTGRQRLALILFGALFLLLFVGFAVAEGIGSPSVPSGDVAIVEDVPDDLGTISEEEFERAIGQQAAQAKLKETPKPGDAKYDELKKATLEELVNSIWLQGQAEELDIAVTDSQVESELEQIKKQNFPTPKAYDKFLAESKFTQKDVDERVKLQILSTQIQEQVNEDAPEPSSAEIAASYEAEKETKFTTPESRDVRVITNEDKAEVEAAKKALEKDNSPASWKKAATKYSSDPTTGKKGGLQPGIQESFLPEPLKRPIFDATTGELIGPVKVQKNYFLLEVVKLVPAKVKTLPEAKNEIVSTIGQETQQEYFAEFVSDYEGRWQARTYCADDFLTEQCANFVGDGHPANAPPACYEEDPKTPANECPSPVTPIQPALPGSITEQKPEGEPFAQRPHPEITQPSGEQGTVVPGGGAPPEGAAPEGAGEAPPPGEAPPEAPPAGE
jgi:parvulin-like peptidyl-prolyl isomerase